FVDVINKTATSPLSTRLPAQRLDELDSIAGAFNQLLDTLQVQFIIFLLATSQEFIDSSLFGSGIFKEFRHNESKDDKSSIKNSSG
ncbi:hypothetical protein MJI12_26985, partial [Salmonella enterica subsp. enterica serovar Kentucky]|nr:hypothetical protein [Salmonella enterica subsp. enterica serovar Kentucky]